LSPACSVSPVLPPAAAAIAKWLFFFAIAIFLVFPVIGLMAGEALF
jgi:uncharacterized membrane protein YtjA (UPF0391 family)